MGILETIHADVKLILQQGAKQMAALDDLKMAEMALATDVMDAIALIQKLQAAAPADAVAAADVEAVVTNLMGLHDKLSAAAPPAPAP
jgi:hypothetical protein